MKCPSCGIPLEDGARFCGACGARVEPKAAAAPEPVTLYSLEASAAAKATEPAASEGEPDDGARAAGVKATSPSATAASAAAAPKTTASAAKAAATPAAAPASAHNPAFETTMLAPSGSSNRAAPSAVPATASSAASSGAKAAPAPETDSAATITSAPTGVRAERRSENSGSRDDMVGRTLNKRYVVGEKVGEGGFGAVFRGKQLATGRDVALKILHPYNLGDPTIVARFRREAEACSRLRNPHTVITFDFDETEDGVLYLAMELLHGKSLHQLERSEGHLAPDRVLQIIDQVAEALGEAHQNGIVHRDMKPENIFIERRAGEDYVKVLDFGIAKMMTDDRGQAALTAVGQTLGTLEFMSPEQLRGLPLDGRSDIYALGILAYEMLTGELPFKDATTPVQIINFHMQKPAPPPSRLKPGLQIPAYVDEIILKMVAKAREDRHADTATLRAHIARVLKGADQREDRFEVYRVVGVVGAAVLIVSALVYFLSR